MSFPTEFCLVLQIITEEYLARFVSLIWQIGVISGTINEIDVISYDFFFQNCSSNIIAVGLSNKVSKSELVQIALGAPERVLRYNSVDALDSNVIHQISAMIEQGPVVKTVEKTVTTTSSKFVNLNLYSLITLLVYATTWLKENRCKEYNRNIMR